MQSLEIPEEPQALDQLLESLPNRAAVFLLWPREGKPFLARTNVLRKRLLRLLGSRPESAKGASRTLTLRGTAQRLEYRFTGSRLESQFLVLDLARKYLGHGYREAIRLRLPPYLKLIQSNPFPRTQITNRIGRAPALYFGPFRSRASAAHFEAEFLDLFQLRRCQEDLLPGPEHPGCIYGEMGRCLRPCQQAVGIEEYRGEADRVAEFLSTGGRSLVAPAESARERLSVEMDFEGAALMHARCKRIEEVLAARDEIACDLTRLNAVIVAPSVAENSVELGLLREGYWRGFSRLEFLHADGSPISLDRRLRELVTPARMLQLSEPRATPTDRMEHLSIIARWRYSAWCDGEMLLFEDPAKISWRKLVNAVSRIAQGQPPRRPSTHS